MTMTTPNFARTFLLAFVLLAPLALAGCASDAGDEPSTQRQETKTFELRPGGSVEYKLDMANGAKLDYSWSTSRPVSYDFHGDTGRDSFTSHKQGTALADQQDDWSAPFAGRHGWYWKNNNAQPVTITLTTDGVYDVIDVV